MPPRQSLFRRFARVVLPTKLQAIISLLLGAGIVAATHIRRFLILIGADDATLKAAGTQVHDRFSSLLVSPGAAILTLITFWATIGLLAYLASWSVLNLVIQARNQLTLGTKYVNRGNWRGPLETLAIKAVSGAFFIISIFLLKLGLALWVVLASASYSSQAIQIFVAAGAAVGAAAQLYAVLACALLSLTPWYREDMFTEV